MESFSTYSEDEVSVLENDLEEEEKLEELDQEELDMVATEELKLKEQEILEAREERENQLTKLWNEFIDSLITAEESWEAIQEALPEIGARRVETLPVAVQKGISKYGKNAFIMMLPDFLGHAKAYGGLEAQKSNE